jgi:hypothetical protein
MEEDTIVVDESNIDEYYYKLYGETHRNVFWQIYIKSKWKIKELLEARVLTDEKITFLHHDLRWTRWVPYNHDGREDLRYLDKKGNLVVRKFKVTFHEGTNVTIAEIPGHYPRPAKKPKGPMKFREAYCYKYKYSLLGFRRSNVWLINYFKLL